MKIVLRLLLCGVDLYDMDGPGMSLFQGAASIHINNSAQDRLEEQEELEDQKRRNEEVIMRLGT